VSLPAIRGPRTATSNIAGRLERLPLSPFHRRFITLVSLGGWFDFYDIFMVAYIGAALRGSGFLDLPQLSFFVSAGFLGMLAATILAAVRRSSSCCSSTRCLPWQARSRRMLAG
jgi:hypothetical protein